MSGGTYLSPEQDEVTGDDDQLTNQGDPEGPISEGRISIREARIPEAKVREHAARTDAIWRRGSRNKHRRRSDDLRKT